MADNAVAGMAPKGFVRTALPAGAAPGLPDLVGGDFNPGAPNERYCGR